MGFNILDLLLPRETKFFSFIDQQVGLVVKSTRIFKELVENIKSSSPDQIKEKLGKITKKTLK